MTGRSTTRRGLLTAGAGAAVLGLLGGCAGTTPAPVRAGSAPRPAPRSTPPAVSTPPGPAMASVHRLHSVARGQDVDLITIVPGGVDPAAVPVCLALHGRGDTASSFVTGTGLAGLLTSAVAAGAPPFAFAVPDGGTTYWMPTQPGDDPQAMLTGELPGWLAGLGLRRDGGSPRGVLGISMGCFGGLAYARGRAADPLAAVAAISPALFTSWPDARSRHVFATEAQWQADEPLRHLAELPAATALGVWCGTGDPFYPAARLLAAGTHPRTVSFAPGAHTLDYWRSVLPAALGYLGSALS